jgi:diguanylate cyclase (GGDEF)-like protein/PAS domain S-box-containing protein
MPKDLLIISLMYVPIALLALILSIEVYSRNRASKKSKLAALLMFAVFSFYIGEYVRALLPIEYSFSILTNWTAPSIILAMSFSTHFYSLFVKLHEKMNKYLFYAICYFPFIAILYILQTGKVVYIFNAVEKQGPWNKFVVEPDGYYTLLAIVTIYSISYLCLLFFAWKKSATKKTKMRYNMLIIGCVILCVWIILFGIVFEAMHWNEHTPPFFFIYGSFFWMIFIRIAMVKYDFLSSDETKYRIVFESSPLGILLLDRNAVVLEANATAHQIFGVSQLTGVTFTKWLSDDAREAFLAGYKNNFDNQKPYHNVEAQLLMKNGNKPVLSVESEFIESEDDLIQFVMIRDVTELKRAERQMQYMAYHDALTGLANSSKLEQSFHESVSTDPKYPIGVMLLDLDRFKQINDALGHDMGDELLQHVAMILTELMNGKGMVARLGGDEFIILFSSPMGVDKSIRLGQQIVKKLGEPILLGERELYVTTSAGISFYPQDGENIQTLIKNADNAMYAAKSQGKNQLCIFDASMSESAVEKLTLANELWKAMDRQELTLHYQPQLDIGKQEVTGVEALLRWNSPLYGSISPARFIPIAEENGLIVKLGEWVLLEACKQTKLWVDQGYKGKVSVNVSTKQFMLPDFAELVLDTLKRTGLPANQLCLEMTESTALQNLKHTHELLSRLTQTGITIALDDFGTGYSSLSVLNSLPFEQIKIDRSFVHNILDHPKERAIVQAIIHLTHSFEGFIVAEGVENKEQQAILKELGCDIIQGFYFVRPAAADQVEAYLDLTKS